MWLGGEAGAGVWLGTGRRRIDKVGVGKVGWVFLWDFVLYLIFFIEAICICVQNA